MLKAFLSHSSKDKDTYVRVVANHLGKSNIEYDEFTFEGGEDIWESIMSGLRESVLFVIFISQNSLESEWVQKEIAEAQKLSSIDLHIYPIIIDRSLSHADPRMPEWLKDSYNLKLVTRPSIAARRIIEHLRQISWERNPLLEQTRRLFIGRNDKMEEFEKRYDDFDKRKPFCLIASGLKEIGRRTFMQNALIKSRIISASYRPYEIYLAREDSIEDLILKLNDLGVTPRITSNLLCMSVSDKAKIVSSIIEEFCRINEILFIVDDGCIVNYNGEISDWFISIIRDGSNQIGICVASKIKVSRAFRRTADCFFCIDIPELNPSERQRLFAKLIEIRNLGLSSDEYMFFCSQLRGYPKEIHYCVNLITDYGISEAKNKSDELTRFNSERVAVLLGKYESQPNILDFIRLLAQSEIFSCSSLLDIAGTNNSELLYNLERECICEFIGDEKSFVRLNDVVRDYIQRNSFDISDVYKTRIRQYVEEFIREEENQERDSSDYMFSVKKALEEGLELDARYLLPSHYLKSMKDLYHKRRNLRRVIDLANVILQHKSNLSPNIIQDIYYYKCLALARLMDYRVLEEAQNIQGPEHNFVLGFFYRRVGRCQDALERLNKIKDERYINVRARREIVQVYLQIEEYDIALDLARRNYEDKRYDAHYIQAYYNCLIYSDSYGKHRDLLRQLINELRLLGSDQAKEMAGCAESWFVAKCDGNVDRALDLVADVKDTWPDAFYPLLARFDIALYGRRLDAMKEAIEELESSSFDITFRKQKAYYLACIGRPDEALEHISVDLNRYPESARSRMIDRIRAYAQEDIGR